MIYTAEKTLMNWQTKYSQTRKPRLKDWLKNSGKLWRR
jgi:hypothetical protein